MADADFVNPTQESIWKVTRQLKKEQCSLYNCVASVLSDAAFVSEVNALYPSTPLLANLRCGLWYTRQADGTCYFKSTDGHNGNWSFSSTRLNWHVCEMAAKHGGVIIVDATRKGKRFPDAMTKTIPIWAAVVNRAIARKRAEAAEKAAADAARCKAEAAAAAGPVTTVALTEAKTGIQLGQQQQEQQRSPSMPSRPSSSSSPSTPMSCHLSPISVFGPGDTEGLGISNSTISTSSSPASSPVCGGSGNNDPGANVASSSPVSFPCPMGIEAETCPRVGSLSQWLHSPLAVADWEAAAAGPGLGLSRIGSGSARRLMVSGLPAASVLTCTPDADKAGEGEEEAAGSRTELTPRTQPKEEQAEADVQGLDAAKGHCPKEQAKAVEACAGDTELAGLVVCVGGGARVTGCCTAWLGQAAEEDCPALSEQTARQQQLQRAARDPCEVGYGALCDGGGREAEGAREYVDLAAASACHVSCSPELPPLPCCYDAAARHHDLLDIHPRRTAHPRVRQHRHPDPECDGADADVDVGGETDPDADTEMCTLPLSALVPPERAASSTSASSSSSSSSSASYCSSRANSCCSDHSDGPRCVSFSGSSGDLSGTAASVFASASGGSSSSGNEELCHSASTFAGNGNDKKDTGTSDDLPCSSDVDLSPPDLCFAAAAAPATPLMPFSIRYVNGSNGAATSPASCAWPRLGAEEASKGPCACGGWGGFRTCPQRQSSGGCCRRGSGSGGPAPGRGAGLGTQPVKEHEPEEQGEGGEEGVEGGWDAGLHLPLWISSNERAQIEKRLDGWVDALLRVGADVEGLAKVLHKPLRPLWISQASTIWVDQVAQPDQLPFTPLYLVSASQPHTYLRQASAACVGVSNGAGDSGSGCTSGVDGDTDADADISDGSAAGGGGTGDDCRSLPRRCRQQGQQHRRQRHRPQRPGQQQHKHHQYHQQQQPHAWTYVYVPGAGDDEESWAAGLTPAVFWAHYPRLLQAGPAGVHDAVRQLLLQEAATLAACGTNSSIVGSVSGSTPATTHGSTLPSSPPELAGDTYPSPSSAAVTATAYAATTDEHHLLPAGCRPAAATATVSGGVAGSGGGGGAPVPGPCGMYLLGPTRIALGDLAAGAAPACWQHVDAVLSCGTTPHPSMLTQAGAEAAAGLESRSGEQGAQQGGAAVQEDEEGGKEGEEGPLQGRYLHLPVEHFKHSRTSLGEQLERALRFLSHHLVRGRTVLIHDTNGLDTCVCVAVALLLACYGPVTGGGGAGGGGGGGEGHSAPEWVHPCGTTAGGTGVGVGHVSKDAVRQRLAYVSALYPLARPTRGMLRQVFNHFVAGRAGAAAVGGGGCAEEEGGEE